MQDAITAGQLLQQVVSGEIDSLTSEEYATLKHALDRPLKLFKEYDDGLRSAKDKKEIGEILTFRGAKYKVARHGSTTPWKKVYDRVFQLLPKTKQALAADIVADEKKDTKKLLAL